MTEGEESKVVSALSTPASVVTYRAVVGLLAMGTISLVAWIGRDIESGIQQLNVSMALVQVSVARNTGRIDGAESRLGRVELSIDELAKENGALDHRVTIIESHRNP